MCVFARQDLVLVLPLLSSSALSTHHDNTSCGQRSSRARQSAAAPTQRLNRRKLKCPCISSYCTCFPRWPPYYTFHSDCCKSIRMNQRTREAMPRWPFAVPKRPLHPLMVVCLVDFKAGHLVCLLLVHSNEEISLKSDAYGYGWFHLSRSHSSSQPYFSFNIA